MACATGAEIAVLFSANRQRSLRLGLAIGLYQPLRHRTIGNSANNLNHFNIVWLS